MIYDPFNVLLDSVCWYFLEDFCIYFYQGNDLKLGVFSRLFHADPGETMVNNTASTNLCL